jgi:hypothetical protein
MKRMVQYRVKADRVAENEDLVRAVYAALREAKPPGLRYASFRLPDGVSFVHLVAYDSAEGGGVLTALPAFKAFTEGIGERCDVAPSNVELKEIGSYGFFEE